jgi:hypothetical protein
MCMLHVSTLGYKPHTCKDARGQTQNILSDSNTHTHTHTHTRKDESKYRNQSHMHSFTHTHTKTHIHTHTHIYIYILTNTHTHTHTHTHKRCTKPKNNTCGFSPLKGTQHSVPCRDSTVLS